LGLSLRQAGAGHPWSPLKDFAQQLYLPLDQ
jgi:hypothetical protein